MSGQVEEGYKRRVRRDRVIVVAVSFASSIVSAVTVTLLMRLGVFDRLLEAVCR